MGGEGARIWPPASSPRASWPSFTPVWWPTLPASLLAGFGFFMFHNTMQVNATQMAPAARGTAVSLFASALFMGQSIGVLLAAGLVGLLGSTAVIAGGSAVLVAVGLYFAQALRRRAELLDAS
jgi:predicted MFS family arabinose efflux permease